MRRELIEENHFYNIDKFFDGGGHGSYGVVLLSYSKRHVYELSRSNCFFHSYTVRACYCRMPYHRDYSLPKKRQLTVIVE